MCSGKYLFSGFTKLFIILLACVSVLACSRGDGVSVDNALKVNQPDAFARYINRIVGLPSGDYTVVVATNNVGESGEFTLTVAYDDGSEEMFEGQWASSDTTATSTNNPGFDIVLHDAGGIRISVDSAIDTYLYLLKRAPGVNGSTDRSGPIFIESDNIIAIDASRIDSEAFGKAYYDTIDPNNAKTTLEDWKVANGYYAALQAGRVINTRFRDTKDLGYGRGLQVWTDTSGNFYSFVENFQVRTVAGLEYTDINLDALILDERQHHFGTNAIEYSTYPYGAGEPSDTGSTHKFAKFYTFDATNANPAIEDHSNETRLNSVNLDGRGNKAMPGSCVYCHGGTVMPLRANNSYRDNCYNDSAATTCNGVNGDTNAKLQLLEVNSFKFWPESPYTQAEQEENIKKINLAVYCTYPGADAAACAQAFCDAPFNPANCDGMGNPTPVLPPAASSGSWSGDFSREVVQGWYDGDANSATADFGASVFNANFVPDGWDPDSSNTPAGSNRTGADTLFLEVVQPACSVCHSRRGTELGSNIGGNGPGGAGPITPGASKDMDFSTYERFISHADQIKTYVYDTGVMPLSLRGYNTFWGGDGPELLAAALNPHLAADNQIALNSNNKVDQPGAAIADAGPDIRVPSPVRLFGINSRFASSYSWSIVEAPAGGGNASLADAATARPLLTASVDGQYTIRLIVDSGLSASDQDFVTITIDSAAASASDLVFDDGVCAIETDCIKTMLTSNTLGQECTACHADGGIVSNNVPVWWSDTQPVSGTTLYEEVLARVDFDEPENSLMLTKPAGSHHYGGLRPGFEVGNLSNNEYYTRMLNWILAGARYSATDMREP